MLGFGGGDDKYQDRLWDWGKDWSGWVDQDWRNIFNQSAQSAKTGQLTPRGQSIYDQSQQLLQPYTQPFEDTQAWKTMQDLFSGFEGNVDPWNNELMAGARQAYKPTVEPLYQDLMDPLKRGIEGQYGNTVDSMLASGVRGGALTDALAEAAMGRSTQLGDMERNLRVQDAQRLDQAWQARANALTNLASNIYNLNQTGQLTRANALAQLAGQQNRQGFLANQSLANLLNALSQGDIDRATSMANLGMNARMMGTQSLAGLEGNANTGLMGGLLGMGSMLGMGLGNSGAGSNMFSGLGSLFGGLFDSGPEQLGQF